MSKQDVIMEAEIMLDEKDQRIAELELLLEHWIKTNNKSLEMIVTLAGRLSAERQRIAELIQAIEKEAKHGEEIHPTG